jgi:MarR family transcriptional regulator, organic hydroperoxide resistance regulator
VKATRENVGYLLAKASQRWNELLREHFIARGFAEVRPAYGSVLLPLFEQDCLRIGEIAHRVRLSKQTMTTLVRATERAGLVTRERDPEDGRAFRITLTARGRAFQPVAEDVLTTLDELVAARIPAVELDTARTVLKGVMTL